jgi:1-acyl-sn-glycerol-3-phosphate acyltransferase
MKRLKLLQLSLWTIVAGSCWLAALSIGIPLLIAKIWFGIDNSWYTTRYVFLPYVTFFLVALGVVIPLLRWLTRFFHKSKTSPVDVVVTLLIGVVSAIPLAILVSVTLPALRVKRFFLYRYRIYNFSISAALFLQGLLTRYHGQIPKKNGRPFFVIAPHTGPGDYELISQAMGTESFNVVAGINLAHNQTTFGDKIIAKTIGPIVEEHSIFLDRNDEKSRREALRKMRSENKAGKNVAIFPEGTRTKAKVLFKGEMLLQTFWDGVFRLAFLEKIPIQPVVFDWPVIWRGKDDPRFGIRPTIIDIYYEEMVYPENFSSFEELRDHCWQVMHNRLASSKKIKRFVKSLNKSPS